ncbi:hypothetical protein [Niveispirillum cyanobacteriorum]|uniref:hypothetical protein n=1 Tax=Niveispirillum cyanobacteriorum TaxID=1612173 RepID=UPI00131A479C|nr:hypothetical protein [Niveispirillum cyanobacteriorum]GGE54566.1 hypothetical protein GCM10011317_10970 [Niveispirillum cyanobacteriorum]
MDTILSATPEPVTAEQLRAACKAVGGTAKVSTDIVKRTLRALEQAGAMFIAGGVQR